MGLVCSRYPCLYAFKLTSCGSVYDLTLGAGACARRVRPCGKSRGHTVGRSAKPGTTFSTVTRWSTTRPPPRQRGGWRRDVSSPQCWLHSWFCCRPTRPMTARKDTLPTFTKWTCQYEYEAPSRTVGPGSCCGLEARAATRLVRATLHRMPIRATARQRWALRCRTILA